MREDGNGKKGELVDVKFNVDSVHSMLECGMVCNYTTGVFDKSSIIQAVKQHTEHAPDQFLSIVQGYIQRANDVMGFVKAIPTIDRSEFKSRGNPPNVGALFGAEQIQTLKVDPDEYSIEGGTVVITGLPAENLDRKPHVNTDKMGLFNQGELQRLNLSYHGLVAPRMGDDRFIMIGILDASPGILTHKTEYCTTENYGEIGFHELRWARQYIHSDREATLISSDHGVFYCPATPKKTEYMLTAMADPAQRKVWMQLTLILDETTFTLFSKRDTAQTLMGNNNNSKLWVSTVLSNLRVSRTMSQSPGLLGKISDYLYAMFGAATGSQSDRAFARLEEFQPIGIIDDDDASSTKTDVSTAVVRRRLMKGGSRGVARSARAMLTMSNTEAELFAFRQARLEAESARRRRRVTAADEDDDEDEDYRDVFTGTPEEEEAEEEDTVDDTFDSVKQRYAETAVWVKYFLPAIETTMSDANADDEISKLTQLERVRNQLLRELSNDIDELFLSVSFLKSAATSKGFNPSFNQHTQFVASSMQEWEKRVALLRDNRDRILRGEKNRHTTTALRGSPSDPNLDKMTNVEKLKLATTMCKESVAKIRAGDTSTNLLVAIAKAEKIAENVINAYELEIIGGFVRSVADAADKDQQLDAAYEAKRAIHADAWQYQNPTNHSAADSIENVVAENESLKPLYGEYEVIRDASSIDAVPGRRDRIDDRVEFLFSRFQTLKTRIRALQAKTPSAQLKQLLDEVESRHRTHSASLRITPQTAGDVSTPTLYQSFMAYADEARAEILRTKKGNGDRMQIAVARIEKQALSDKARNIIRRRLARAKEGVAVMGDVPDSITDKQLLAYLNTTLPQGSILPNAENKLDRDHKTFAVKLENIDAVETLAVQTLTLHGQKV